jgi:hypothetical protein
MFQVAEWKYRNVLSFHNGPIDCLEKMTFDLYPGIHVFASLNERYKKNINNHSVLYRTGGGQGSHETNLNTACYRAISEALERWAFYELKNENEFNLDNTTGGMACYPSWTNHQAQSSARLEAIERWSIIAFWERKIFISSEFLKNSIFNEIEVFTLHTPFANEHVVILHTRSLKRKKHIYAFACAQTKQHAINKAMVELCRNSRTIDRHGDMLHEKIKCTSEKRLIYFSEDYGYDAFQEQIKKNCCLIVKNKPTLLIDKELIGPWTAYAPVWRTLFSPISEGYLDKNDSTYFYF